MQGLKGFNAEKRMKKLGLMTLEERRERGRDVIDLERFYKD